MSSVDAKLSQSAGSHDTMADEIARVARLIGAHAEHIGLPRLRSGCARVDGVRIDALRAWEIGSPFQWSTSRGVTVTSFHSSGICVTGDGILLARWERAPRVPLFAIALRRRDPLELATWCPRDADACARVLQLLRAAVALLRPTRVVGDTHR